MVTSLAEVWIEIEVDLTAIAIPSVTSLAEVWIEISAYNHNSTPFIVTSLAEVWIEIATSLIFSVCSSSLPLRKCGLKSVPVLEVH